MPGDGRGLTGLLGRVLEDLAAVVAGHAHLARRELGEDLAAARRNLVRHLAGVLLLATGLVLLFAGIALWLGQLLGNPVLGLLWVGGVLALAGGVVAARARGRLFRRAYLASSRREAGETLRWLREDLLPRLYRGRR